MTITPSQLATDFPEFSNPTTYPPSLVNFWLGVAYKLLNAQRWGSLLDYGAELYACHYIVLSARAEATAAKGGIPGTIQGVVVNKAVDKVSIGYDASNVTLEGGADYNLTQYGIMFLKLARQAGSGGMQLTGCLNPTQQGIFPW